jgi:hypothetical protein
MQIKRNVYNFVIYNVSFTITDPTIQGRHATTLNTGIILE